MKNELINLRALGISAATKYSYKRPERKLLERFPSPRARAGNGFVIVIVAPEFTSLCPKTGQPDFATIKISYTPDQWCVESKSLKLYLGSFRMHGEFHEACVNRILQDLVDLLEPMSMTVVGEFTPRGGISFWPTATFVGPFIKRRRKA